MRLAEKMAVPDWIITTRRSVGGRQTNRDWVGSPREFIWLLEDISGSLKTIMVMCSGWK